MIGIFQEFSCTPPSSLYDLFQIRRVYSQVFHYFSSVRDGYVKRGGSIFNLAGFEPTGEYTFPGMSSVATLVTVDYLPGVYY